MNKLRVFDAFSGIGGFRFGLKNSKLFHDSSSFVGYTDSDGLCRKVYSEIFNCPEEKCFDQIQDIHTTANPTNECNAATNWGMPVILTFWATKTPIIDPKTKEGSNNLS